MAHIAVIGAGFGGISAAAYLAHAGHQVDVYEKNDWAGGRTRVLEANGFRFDMGPSWYWMPGEHDRWFRDFGEDPRDYFDASRVDPSYTVYFGDVVPDEQRNRLNMPVDIDRAAALFESYESGAGVALRRHLADTARKYRFAMDNFIYTNFFSIFDFVNWKSISNLRLLNILQSYGARIRRRFKHPYLRRVLEFPVVFLGSDARSTPAVYSLMNHIDFELGTWYPHGGFSVIPRSMQRVAEKLGVTFHFGHEVTGFETTAAGVDAITVTAGGEALRVEADIVVANADYPYIESLLPENRRGVSGTRWKKAKLAPAVLNYYLGFDIPLDQMAHHTFFFDADWDAHFDAVYGSKRWPEKPLFYLHIPSKTDPGAAPRDHEAVFLLVPVAPGLQETPELRQRYLDHVLDRMEALTGIPLRDHLVFRSDYSLSDFERDYHAFQGNAFGLGQTLFQTAWFRPPNRSPKVPNLYFAGQYTVPGTGTTMSMISGKVVAERIAHDLRSP